MTERLILEEKFMDLECLAELNKALEKDGTPKIFLGKCKSELSNKAYSTKRSSSKFSKKQCLLS